MDILIFRVLQSGQSKCLLLLYKHLPDKYYAFNNHLNSQGKCQSVLTIPHN